MFLLLIYVVIGIALLTAGGEALVRGALATAARMGVSPLLSGLVIVGFATSAPELVISVNAAINGQSDIAVGNIVGSNIANILIILGLCAVIMPLAVKPLALGRDAATVVVSSILFVVLIADGMMSRVDATIFLAALLAYLIWAYRTERYDAATAAETPKTGSQDSGWMPASWPTTIVMLVLGMVLLISGARVMLLGAIGLAEMLGLSEALIGLTLVAVGTSLPELSISVIATVRRHADVAVGNILGSNIFNLLGILGISALVQPLPIAGRILAFDHWVMLVTSSVLLLFLYTARRLSRGEGMILLCGYVVYVVISFNY